MDHRLKWIRIPPAPANVLPANRRRTGNDREDSRFLPPRTVGGPVCLWPLWLWLVLHTASSRRCDSQRRREPGDRADRVAGPSPKDMEDQITYPLSVALQAVPGSKSVRGKSMFGFSFVQVTFDDNVDFYWARSRVAEQLTTVSGSLPDGVTPTLAPDATALGQIYYYVLEPPPGMDLAELRSKQDFFIKYALQSVDGVAEVASIGGYVRQYQIEVDPDKLRFHDIPLEQGHRRGEGVEYRRRRQDGRIRRHGVHRPRQGLHRLGQDRTGNDRADRKHGRAHPRRRAGPSQRSGPRADRARLSPRGARLQRPGSGRRRGGDALRREPARCDRARQSRRSPRWNRNWAASRSTASTIARC